MSEIEFQQSIEDIVKKYIQNYKISIIERRQNTASSLDTTLAVVFKDGSITEDLLRELILFQINSDNRNSISFETSREINNLDYEVIIFKAEIFYTF